MGETKRCKRATLRSRVLSHPYREVMAEAQREREVVKSPEGQALLGAIFEAVLAYSDFLERRDSDLGMGR